MSKKAFIIIDLQKDYLWDKRKPMFTYDTAKLVGNVNKAIDSYKERGYDIIYIKQNRPKEKLGIYIFCNSNNIKFALDSGIFRIKKYPFCANNSYCT